MHRHHCYRPLFLFEGLLGKFIAVPPRPGKRPTGAGNARIVRRVLQRLRAAWPRTRIVLRGDAHFAHPELMQLAVENPQLDCIFGLVGNRALSPLAESFLADHRRRAGRLLPTPTRTDHEIASRAASWPTGRTSLASVTIQPTEHRFLIPVMS